MHERYPWVFLDIGKFGGLIETLDESIKYPICFERIGQRARDHHRGPDLRQHGHPLREMDLHDARHHAIGDRVYILTTGAYTQSYSSICFNGFPPLAVYILK